MPVYAIEYFIFITSKNVEKKIKIRIQVSSHVQNVSQ